MPAPRCIPSTLMLLGVMAAGPLVSPLAAQTARPVEVTLDQDAVEVSHPAGAAGLHAVFAVTNRGADTATYQLDCVGLGRVRCAGLKHRHLTLPPGHRAEVVAYYEVGDAGRGLLVLTAARHAAGGRARARLAVRVQ